MSKAYVIPLFFACTFTAMSANEANSKNVVEKKTATIIEKLNAVHTVNTQEQKKLLDDEIIVNAVIIHGSNIVPQDAIRAKLPFVIGQKFNVLQTSQAIKILMALGFFSQVRVYVQTYENKTLDVHIMLTERPKVAGFVFKGNKHLADKKITKEMKLESVLTMTEKELPVLNNKLKQLYKKQNYHHAKIKSHLETTKEGNVIIHFTVNEGKPSYVEKISFSGNKKVSDKQLKKLLVSKEVWPFSMMDGSGVYQDERIKYGDILRLQDGYTSSGFYHAKVTDVKVEQNEKNGNYHLTYHIHEGDAYTIQEVSFPETDFLTKDELLGAVAVRKGQLYSSELIKTSMENLTTLFGEYGYIFATIEPAIEVDEEHRTITVKFYFDLHDKMFLHRINIKGNKKSQEKIIRRIVTLDEGDLITNKKMEQTKNRLKALGYFKEETGVNWKTTKINETQADLDLMLEEVKTGKFNVSLGWGNSAKKQSSGSQKGASAGIHISDRNLGGAGIVANIDSNISAGNKGISLAVMSPWMFNKPVRGSFNIFFDNNEYEDGLKNVDKSPTNNTFGFGFGTGYFFKDFLGGALIDAGVGFERIKFSNPVTATMRMSPLEQASYQLILDRNFQSGNQVWLNASIGQDERNGFHFISDGHQWKWNNRIAFPASNSGFNYFKSDFDIAWYTPLIGTDSLVLCLHGQLGYIKPLNGKNIPWQTLYHVGGPQTVRGYEFGQISPTWNQDSLGATKSFVFNAELIIPVNESKSTRFVFFYDGGAGWDVPYKESLQANIEKINPNLDFNSYLENNQFFFRHSVGFGIRITSPSPIQIDFGIKLNPAKRFRNHLTEMHLTMSKDF